MTFKKTILFIGLTVLAGTGIIGSLFFTTKGAQFLINQYLRRLIHAESIVISDTKGTLVNGITLKGIAISGLDKLPPASIVRIQEATVSYPFLHFLKANITIANGRLDLPQSGLILFYGSLTDSIVHCNIYSKIIQIHALPHFLKTQQNAFFVNALIADIDIFVTQTIRKPHINGTFTVKEMRLQNCSLHAMDCSVDLDLIRHGKEWFPRGKLALKSGKIVFPKTNVDITAGSIIFSDDPQKPTLNIHGSANIGNTNIALVLQGTPENPLLKLSSSPPLPEEELIVMLITGSNWEGTRQSLIEGKVSAGLVKDFIDFAFFGGSERKLEESLGIKAISLEYDKDAIGVGITKELTSSTSVSYGIKQAQGNETNSTTTQSIGLEHKLTDTLSIQGEADIATTPAQTNNTDAPTDSKILLKIKKAF